MKGPSTTANKKPSASSPPAKPDRPPLLGEIQIIRGIEQGTDQWRALRLGKITASCFNDVQAGGVGSAPSKTRDLYMRKLAGEIITGIPAEHYTNKYMERGNAMEPQARAKYAFMKNVDLDQITFIDRGRIGGSPDAFVGTDGILEIKTMAPHLLIEHISRDGIAVEHHAQCQGLLWLSDREWIDCASYYTGMPMKVARMYRDQNYIRNLERAVVSFLADLDEMVARVKSVEERA
jgi:hypothetical protein